MTDVPVPQIAKLIALLPPAPAAWVQAAQSLPALRSTLDELVERCRADQQARAAILADLERALGEAGIVPEPQAIRYLRLSLDD